MSRFAIIMVGILLICPLRTFAGEVDDETDMETENMISESEGAVAAQQARQAELQRVREETRRQTLANQAAIAKAHEQEKAEADAIARAETEITTLKQESQKLAEQRKTAQAVTAKAVAKRQLLIRWLNYYKRQNALMQAEIDKQNAKLASANKDSVELHRRINNQTTQIAQKHAAQQQAARVPAVATTSTSAAISQ